MSWFLAIGTDEYSAEILSRDYEYGEDLSPSETLTFNFIVQSNFRMWENEFYQYQMGLFEDEVQPRRDTWEAVVRDNRPYEEQ